LIKHYDLKKVISSSPVVLHVNFDKNNFLDSFNFDEEIKNQHLKFELRWAEFPTAARDWLGFFGFFSYLVMT
jgi:hypothetical protein